ncbi:urease accessory protein UreF [Novosphingobium flavum]|uniref:Urease accessory protein UreF n=2 Tax=Novosphingobium flavum TaxID=1778672 RepID=A0A7X1KL33_9SPHN|nr:urease accessory protein UreF [Novosphingobium flavum]
MLTEPALHLLLAWTSPSLPIGGFTYSHGLETAVDAGDVRRWGELVDYVEAVIARGGGWVDAVLIARAMELAHDPAAFDAVAELGAAFRASSETALESHQQGAAFLSVVRKAWPHPALDAFAERLGEHPCAHAAVFALACAAHGIAPAAAIHGFLHSTAANLISAGVRLVPLGQTDGQRAMAAIGQVIGGIAARARACPLDDLGTATPVLELYSFHHETLYTRLFRS